MRVRLRSLPCSLGALVLAASALALSACTPAPADEPEAAGSNYLIDACPGSSDGPLWVLPGTPNSNKACQTPVDVEVGGVAGAGAGGGSCSIASTLYPPFALSWDDTGNEYTAEVTADASGLYGTSSSDRAALAKSFAAFRQALVGLQTGGSSCFLPGGAELVAQRLAQAMPLPLDEVLLYRYGYDASAHTVELTPGMRVRLVNAGFFDETTATTGDVEPAFSGTGVGILEVDSGPLGTDPTKLPKLSLDPFLSPFALVIDMPTEFPKFPTVRYAATVLDLVGTDDVEPYLGLVYPPSTTQIPAIDTPSTDPTKLPVLLWGTTPQDLQGKMTDLKNGDVTDACRTSGVCTALYGRGAPIPEIAIRLDGETVWVPVGTTLRQVIDSTRDWTGPDTTPTSQLQGLLQRWIPPFSQGQGASLVRVTFPVDQPSFNAGPLLRPSAYDVPLVRGDHVTLGPNAGGGS